MTEKQFITDNVVMIDSDKRDLPLTQSNVAFDIPMTQTKHWSLFCSGSPQQYNFRLLTRVESLYITYADTITFSPLVKIVFYETTKKDSYTPVHELVGGASFRKYLFVTSCKDVLPTTATRRYKCSFTKQINMQEKSGYRVELYDVDDLPLVCDRFVLTLALGVSL